MKNNKFLFVIIIGIMILAGGGIVYFANPESAIAPAPASPTPSQQPIQPGPFEGQTEQTAPSSSQTPPLSSLTGRELVKTCTTEMATQFHLHQHLVVLIDKKPINISANIGIDFEKNCMSPIHTHQAGGIIHVESPVKADFTLGDFFYNYKVAFNKNQYGNYKVDKDYGLKMYVNGVESQDFENLLLQDRQDIVIVYYKLAEGSGYLPPAYDW